MGCIFSAPEVEGGGGQRAEPGPPRVDAGIAGKGRVAATPPTSSDAVATVSAAGGVDGAAYAGGYGGYKPGAPGGPVLRYQPAHGAPPPPQQQTDAPQPRAANPRQQQQQQAADGHLSQQEQRRRSLQQAQHQQFQHPPQPNAAAAHPPQPATAQPLSPQQLNQQQQQAQLQLDQKQQLQQKPPQQEQDRHIRRSLTPPLPAGAAAALRVASPPLPPAAPAPGNNGNGAGPRPPSPAPPAPQSSSVRGGASSGVQVLRGGPRGTKLRERRGGVSASFTELQGQLATDAGVLSIVNTRAAGLKHIGFGPFKRENQDEFFIQVGHYGSQPGANLFCVFDGHGSYGKDAAAYSRQVLPALLDSELKKFFGRNPSAGEPAAASTTKGAVEVLITEVFSETEKSLTRAGVNLASSGTTASVALQLGNRLWVAAAGDSRVILCQRFAPGAGKWRAQPLTIDHRPRRPSERQRVEAAGARVQPKRLPSGRMVGEPRLWLQEVSSPGLLLSRSLGDLMAATVGCTSDPEITYTTLQPGRDQFVVLATDGVWDVLTNEQVCDIVVESPDPHIACRRVLDAALYEWEERMSADNITVLVAEFDWGDASLDRSAEDEESLALGGPSVTTAVARSSSGGGCGARSSGGGGGGGSSGGSSDGGSSAARQLPPAPPVVGATGLVG